MTKVVLLDREKAVHLDEVSEDMLLNPDLVGEEYFGKLKVVVKEFEKRGWLL